MHPLLAKLGYRVMRAYAWFRRPQTLGVKVVLRDSQGRFLLVKHTYLDGWHFPGGRVDRTESLPTAAQREVLEEVGLHIEVHAQNLFGVYTNFTDFKHDHVAMFVVPTWQQMPLKIRLWEIEKAEFFSADSLPSDTTAGTLQRIAEIQGISEVRERW